MKKMNGDTVKTWKDACEAAKAAKATHATAAAAERAARGRGNVMNPEAFADVLVLEIASLEAADRAAELEREATLAQDQQEVAAGDLLALKADPVKLREDLGALVAREDALRAELAAAEQATYARVVEAREAEAELRAMRRTAGLPPPRRIPDLGARGLLDALENPSPPAEKPSAGRIWQLREEETDIRARLEREAREREAQLEEESRAKREREAEVRRADEKRARDLAAEREAYAKKEIDRQKLADAQRARSRSA